MTSKFLITTADERTWSRERSVLFLGEWCRRYDRMQIWEGMDATVAEPFGLRAGQKERDLTYLNALSSQLLVEVADLLNAYHNTRHSLRYWNIVLGHWLARYVETAFNRYFTLEQALKNHNVSGTAIFDSNEYSLVTNDSLTCIRACNDDIWNHVFYSKIINFWQNLKIKIDSVPLQGVGGFVQKRNRIAEPRTASKRIILKVVNKILPKLTRKHDAFIVGSYLPLKTEIMLQLSLAQCPQLWRSPILKSYVHDPVTRLGLSLEAKKYNGFEQFVRQLLVEIIPICYLEGYSQLVEEVQSLPWPAEPKFIFTSNNFNTDEIFKVWAASKVDQGVPYFVGQHGNNYGTHFYAGSSSRPERSTSNKFFTWGWSDGSANVVPAFNFKTAERKPNIIDIEGGLLLIEAFVPHLTTPWDSYFEYGLYQEEQLRFNEALPEAIQNKLTVRLHAEYKNQKWFDEQRWKDRFPNIQIETGTASISELISKSRLVVYSFDSTGILETLALNIPMLCFWRNKLDHLLPSAKPFYELLRKAGILLDTPEQAAENVALHWGNVNEWWRSQTVQDARQAFCAMYSRTDKNPVRKMKKLLTKHEDKELISFIR